MRVCVSVRITTAKKKMLGEDVDIGLSAHDDYAAYIIHQASSLHLSPRFQNARGAAVDVVYVGPFHTAADLAGGGLSTASIAVPTEEVEVLLHGWVEKWSGVHWMQLLQEVDPRGCPLSGLDPSNFLDGISGSYKPSNLVGSTPKRGSSEYEVVAEVGFVLHLSTKDLWRDSSQEALRAARRDGTFVTSNASQQKAKGLASRDDETLLQNAAESLMAFSRMAQEHPGITAKVFVDESGDGEYLQFTAAEVAS